MSVISHLFAKLTAFAVLFVLLAIESVAQISVTYTSNGTFVVPAGVTEVTVECWGAGGSGGTRTNNGVGGGGGGGAYARSVLTVTPGSYTVTVGTGSSGTSPGGDSWFGTAATVMAKGGQSAADNSTSAATGGLASASIGNQVTRNGGSGAAGSGSVSGGGGSSAGPNAAGAAGSGSNGGTAPAGGGDGGDGLTSGASQNNGGNASSPGGGGGGAKRTSFGTRTGGTGGNGQVIISYQIEGICMNAVASNAIPDNNLTYTSFGIPVTGLPTVLGTGAGQARLESVEFIISHATNDHLDITLTSPAGSTRTLSMDRFGSGDNYGNPSSCPGSAFVMRDDGATLTNSNTNNPTGPYAPTQTLAGFTGNPNGTWNFNVRDDASGTTGNLRYLKLNFCVVPAQPSITSNSPVCSGTALSLSATSTGATTFAWSGSGTFSPNNTSASVTLNNATTGTYTVTASNACGSTEASTNVVVNQSPSGVTANSSSSAVCSTSNLVDLTGSGTAPGTTILEQSFNSGAGGWVTENNSTGGTSGARAAAAWTLRPDDYTWNGSNTVNFHSNDASQFYLTNSDATSSSVSTITILRSPVFSTSGFSNASIDFYHVFRQNGVTPNDRGYVEASTNGSSWTTLQTYSTTQGTSNGFVAGTVNLTAPFLNQSTVYIRFRYTAPYGWYWGIDNVKVSGTGTPSFSWTSTPSGFTSGAQNPSNVAVTQNTTYTLTATSPNGCTVSANTATITYTAAPNAGSNGTLSICSNASAANLLSALGGSPEAGGAWSGPSPVVGGLYDPATMEPGIYTYTISAPPCMAATASVTVTENTATAWYADIDGDGFGNAADMVMACSQPMGRVANSTDCDDDQVLYADNDGDGFGAGAPVACGVPNNVDCDDTQILHADADGDGFGAAANAPCGIADGSDCDDTQLLYADNDGDGFGAGSPVACGVADNSDCDDDAILYADTDGDGYGAGSPVACGVANNNDDCPTVPGLVGSTCDAQPGPGFLLGQLNNACACVAIPCTENIVLELRSDANSNQIGWEILDQNSDLVLCSGGAPGEPYPYGITSPIAPDCCLPVGCYRLRVLDAGGDGFVGGGITGGYQLRESGMNGRRIIDNMGNFTGGATSTLAATYDNGAFCLPVGDDRPIFSSCDKQDWVNHKFIVATENIAVSAQYGINNANSGYEFWFFEPNGAYSFRRFRSHATSDGTGTGALRANHFKINGWMNSIATPHIPQDMLLNVRIRGRVNGMNLPFGPACLFKLDAALAACPLVKLQDNPLNTSDYSCGVMRVFGGNNSAANKIVANPPQFTPTVASNMVRYQFRFRIPGEYPNPGSCIVRPPQTSPALHLNWSSGDKLKCNTQYEVDVRVSKDGGATWCVADGEPTCGPNPTIWGKVCMINITTSTFYPSSFQGGSSAFVPAQEGNLTMYPNPNNGEQLMLSLTNVERGVSTLNVDIYDLTGKRVVARSIAIQDGYVNSSLDLNRELRSGVYMVNITAGSMTYTERLVIQQ